jgi:hypothetical protein
MSPSSKCAVGIGHWIAPAWKPSGSCQSMVGGAPESPEN